MLNKWDDRKLAIQEHIHENIEWTITPVGEKVSVEFTFTPNEETKKLLPEVTATFPVTTIVYDSQEEFDAKSSTHYDSTAVFLTMVAVQEDILISLNERKSGLFTVKEMEYMPVSALTATVFTQFGRLVFSGGKVRWLKQKQKYIYQKAVPSPNGIKILRVSTFLNGG